MNHSKKYSIAVAIMAAAICVSAQAQNSEEECVEALLQQMTLQEKIGQLNQLSIGGYNHGTAGQVRAGMVGSFLNEVNPKVLNHYQ
jgi:beta-glucosidase